MLFDETQQMSFWNLIFQAEVIKQRLRTVCCPIMISRPPNVEINSSIGKSGLLISRTSHHRKHQLRDFFNSHGSRVENRRSDCSLPVDM